MCCIDLLMTRTVTRWPKCQGWRRGCCSPCKARLIHSSSRTGRTISIMLFSNTNCSSFLPSVACLEHGVFCQTERFCSVQSFSSYVHLVHHGMLAHCAGLAIYCSIWVQLQLYSFYFLWSAWWGVYFGRFAICDAIYTCCYTS